MIRPQELIRSFFAFVILGSCVHAYSIVPVAASQTDDIVIAVIGPFTGDNATFGRQMFQGAKQATDDINASGGVLGRRIKLINKDSRCNPEQAINAAKQLVSEGVKFITGHLCDAAAIAASKIYRSGNILHIASGTTSPTLTRDKKPNIFRVYPADDQQAAMAAQLIASRYGDKRVAILHDRTSFGKSVATEAELQLHKAGIEVVLHEDYDPRSRNFTPLLARLTNSRVEVIYATGWYWSAIGLLVSQAHKMDFKPQIISTDALVTDGYWRMAGKAAEGTLMTFAADPRDNPAAATVVKKFRERNEDPVYFTLYAYAAVQIWAHAAKIAQSFETHTLVKTLNSSGFDTVLGSIQFDEYGEATPPSLAWYVWRKGRYHRYAVK
jgi:branched-chain amino acid transport system substrate-binding protein